MAAEPFRTAERSKEFDRSYARLQKATRKQVEKTISLLFTNPAHPGLEAHPIRPDKYYWEAYVNRGDRLIYVPEGSHLFLVDVIPHDDIDRYGRAL